MKKTLHHRFLLGLLVFTAFLSLVPSQVLAVSGDIYINPHGGPVINGTTFTVDIRGDVSRPFISGGATIGVTYPTNLLQATSASSSGGALGGNNPTINNGTVNFTVFNLWGVAVNDQMIFRITFKAIGTGNATLNFTPGTNINDGPTAPRSSTFVIQSATCPAGQIGTPPTCSTPPPPTPTPPAPTPKPSPQPSTPPTPSIAPTPTFDTTAPTPSVEEILAPETESDGGLQIKDVKVTASRQKTSISWTLNRPEITTTVSYGTSKENMTTKATVIPLGGDSFRTDLSSLKPGTLYHFAIRAVSSDSLQGANYNGTLTTRGYPVELIVQQNGVLAPGAKVTIGTRSFTANKNAVITTELGEGNFDASINPIGSTESYMTSFTVAKKPIPSSGNPERQVFVLNGFINTGSSAPDDTMAFIIIGGIVAGLVGVSSIIGFLVYRRRQSQLMDTNEVDQDLLITNYGDAYTSYQENQDTLTPNLDTIHTPPQQDDAMQSMPNPVATQTAPLESLSEVEPAPSHNFDTTALPLPPDPGVAPNQELTQDTQQSNISAEVATEEERIAPALAQIESTQLPSADEPSAIYDATTGELDIIHHPAQDISSTPPSSIPPERSAPDPTTLAPPDLDSHQTPPPPTPSTKPMGLGV